MQSQARTVSKDEYLQRAFEAVNSSDVFLLTNSERMAALWYATPLDQRIALLEQQIEAQRNKAWEMIYSARRWQMRGHADRCADNLKYARQCRKTMWGFRAALKETLAKRDAVNLQAAE